MSKRILLAGRPNVGKSSLFNQISDSFAIVSNYPGTTVSVSRGTLKSPHEKIEILDLPGMYHFYGLTDEEIVAQKALLEEKEDLIVHVMDVKSLPLQLPFLLCLLELGKPVVVVLNMMDEAKACGIEIDVKGLSQELGVQIYSISVIKKQGLKELHNALAGSWEGMYPSGNSHLSFISESSLVKKKPEIFQNEIKDVCGSPVLIQYMVIYRVKDILQKLDNDCETFTEEFDHYSYEIHGHLRETCKKILKNFYVRKEFSFRFQRTLSGFMVHPLWGSILLLLFLYFGLYQFVGQFAAGTVVGLLENDLFGEILVPYCKSGLEKWIPWSWVVDLLVGEYGLLSLGITYALALVLPIVFFFSLVFSVVEDSGYFPRLALLSDKIFKLVGLNGKAIIPIVLGLGCDTMATITTRTLESNKQKIITTYLLSFVIPCSAQLALITGLLGALGFTYWLGYVFFLMFLFLITGLILKRFLPGQKAMFQMEMPRLRVPRIGAVLIKSFARMKWYFLEVIPLFLWASVILFALDKLSVLQKVVGYIEPMMGWLGLPVTAAESFLIGFFRRDFGAAGFFSLVQEDQAAITPHQILVASVTLTLFVPCVAQFMVTWKERGVKVAVLMLFSISLLAMVCGILLHHLLLGIGV